MGPCADDNLGQMHSKIVTVKSGIGLAKVKRRFLV